MEAALAFLLQFGDDTFGPYLIDSLQPPVALDVCEHFPIIAFQRSSLSRAIHDACYRAVDRTVSDEVLHRVAALQSQTDALFLQLEQAETDRAKSQARAKVLHRIIQRLQSQLTRKYCASSCGYGRRSCQRARRGVRTSDTAGAAGCAGRAHLAGNIPLWRGTGGALFRGWGNFRAPALVVGRWWSSA